MNRREVITSGLAVPLSLVTPALAQSPFPIGDMHYHAFFDRGQSTPRSGPVRAVMAGGNATLIAWSLAGDGFWTGVTPRGHAQVSVPNPGDTFGWFQRELGRIKKHIADQGLKIVTRRSDVELALQGDPHVVLAIEGASFIENDPGRVQMAYDLGVRHIQLVHFIRNTIGDFQTEKPEHNGLTAIGRSVVEECNRLGILIDLAHATSQTVAGVLAVSKMPVVWSHGSVTYSGRPHWSMMVWKARQLTLGEARSITRKGGVVGLWALRPDVGASIESYADRLSGMADRLGEDHVAFGTDLNGLLTGGMMSNYADLRRVVEHWQRQRVREARIRKIAIGNYARVLQAAMRS